MFDKKSADISIEGFDVNDPACWLKINPKLTGFYRVSKTEICTVKCQIPNVLLLNYADYRTNGNSVFKHKFGHFKPNANAQLLV